MPPERLNEIEMRIVGKHRCLNSPRQGRNDEVGQRDVVSLASELASEGRRVAPILPSWFQIVSQAQPGGDPVSLVPAAKSAQDFRQNRTSNHDPIFVEEGIQRPFLA